MFALIRNGKVVEISERVQNTTWRGQWINVAYNAEQPKVGYNAALYGAAWHFWKPALPPSDIRPQALAELVASDEIVIRCVELGHQVPADWVAYRKDLRAIAGMASGTVQPPLPQKPAKPPEI